MIENCDVNGSTPGNLDVQLEKNENLIDGSFSCTMHSSNIGINMYKLQHRVL